MEGKFGLELSVNEPHSDDMTTPAPAAIDYGNIITDAILQGRKEGTETMVQAFTDMAARSLLDAGFVTALGVALVAAVLLIVGAFQSGRFHVAVLLLGVLAVLAAITNQALSTVTVNWMSAGIGFLLIAAIALKGWRILASLVRIFGP